jgi:hypothetical protein
LKLLENGSGSAGLDLFGEVNADHA